ncbi:MAG: PD40 domain-containing protein [Bacteroidetes bacterium]|nr:PD40 domain-containing protein [Bacteroidota bacterium]
MTQIIRKRINILRFLVYGFIFLISLTGDWGLKTESCFSQPTVFKADPAAAKQFFDEGNYFSAIKVYLLLLKKDPNNVDYNQKIAQSYLRSNSIKAKAIPHLEFLIKHEKFSDEVWLDLGDAYHYANRFDDATRAYNKFKEKAVKDKKASAMVGRLIEQCYNGAELIKRPVNVTFENLGKNVNSEFPDFYPVVSPDESTLYFTTRRKSPTAIQPEFDGLYPSDIFYTNMKNKKWEKAQTIGNLINTNLDEQAVDISDDGTILLFYIDYIDIFGDIWISRRLNNKQKWLKSEPLPENINVGLETSASIFKNPLTEEEQLLIASSRPGTADNPNYGETDIYISRKLPNGSWSDPQNLGTNINTQYKEEFPQFSEDGKTLYFASEGHSSMGGFDIFKSVWDEVGQTWSPPKNLGYPINTSDDDVNISFTSGGRIAYLSTMREGGMGDLDIYRLILDDVEAKASVYKGYIVTEDTLTKVKKARIEILNKKDNDLQGIYVPDPNTGYYVMALPPGKWAMKVEAKGYAPYTEDIVIFDEVLKFSPEVTKNIKLKKL